MSNADAVIAALRTGHDGLAELVTTFSDDDLAAPSGASEWDIAQVLSHLGSGAVITKAGLDAALAGEERPGGDFNQSVWDEWNAMSRREQADGFVAASAALTDRYESIDDTTRDEVRIDLGFLPEPVDLATAARMRLNELALHSWDVRVASDAGAVLPADAAAALLHGEPNMLGWIAKPDQLRGTTAVVEVRTSDPESVFTLNLDTSVSTVLAAPDEAAGTLALPAESWLRLAAGRLAPEHTPDDVTATGAADLDLLRKVFPGY